MTSQDRSSSAGCESKIEVKHDDDKSIPQAQGKAHSEPAKYKKKPFKHYPPKPKGPVSSTNVVEDGQKQPSPPTSARISFSTEVKWDWLNTWFVATNATITCTGRREWLRNYRTVKKFPVSYGEVDTFALCVGNMVLKTPDNTLTFAEVYYVPDITQNFLSVPRLLKSGAHVSFDLDGGELKRGDRCVGKLERVHGSYRINGIPQLQVS